MASPKSKAMLSVLRLFKAANSRTDFKRSDFGGNDDDEEETVSYILCVRKPEDLKKAEEAEDCFIVDLKNLSLGANSSSGDEEDITVLAQKGKVACRDYPHSRHLCGNKPFKSSSHESHCEKCYCYVCEIPAPCKKWSNVSKDRCLNHCDASDDIEFWRTQKNLKKNSK